MPVNLTKPKMVECACDNNQPLQLPNKLSHRPCVTFCDYVSDHSTVDYVITYEVDPYNCHTV